MNIPKRIWCRTFQTVMRAALPMLPYRKPEILHSVSQVPDALRKEGCRAVILVTDKCIRDCGITEQLENALREADMTVSVFETVANPTTAVIDEAVKMYGNDGCEALIGFGGGSSIDTAKAVGALVVNPNKTLKDMSGILKVRKKLPPLFAVPTTAGTGSETTLAAVITDSETRHKYPVNDFPLIPKYAVLDPEATKTLPAHLTASTGMDALTHAVEAYIGRSTTRETRREAIMAVRLIFRYLERSYKDGNDLHARKEMLLAAFLAGDAFSKSYVGYVHAVAHSLGGKYNMPHGLVNAVILPYVLEDYGSAIYSKLKDLAAAAGITAEETPEKEAAELFIKEIRRMNRDMGIPEKLQGILDEDIPDLAKKADAEANPLYPVPVLMDTEKLERFYHMVQAQQAASDPQPVKTGDGVSEDSTSAAKGRREDAA